MAPQKTLKNEATCAGVGLHTGRKVQIVITPAPEDTGIVFVRRDIIEHNVIPATLASVKNTCLATTIGCNGTGISTVEHLLSALRGMEIDNAVIEVNGPEIPIMDGSSRPFVELLKGAGLEVQGKGRTSLAVKKEVKVSDGQGEAMFLPGDGFKITYRIDFPHPLIGEQSFSFRFTPAVYEEEVSSARTFGFLKDVEDLQAKGLALGGSLKNAIILNEDRIINKGGLRCPDEFVKHKVLDAIGDLSLVGMPINGHFVAFRSGHRLNNLLLKELLAHQDNYVLTNGKGTPAPGRI